MCKNFENIHWISGINPPISFRWSKNISRKFQKNWLCQWKVGNPPSPQPPRILMIWESCNLKERKLYFGLWLKIVSIELKRKQYILHKNYCNFHLNYFLSGHLPLICWMRAFQPTKKKPDCRHNPMMDRIIVLNFS